MHDVEQQYQYAQNKKGLFSCAWAVFDPTDGNYFGRTNAVPSKSEENWEARLVMKFLFSKY